MSSSFVFLFENSLVLRSRKTNGLDKPINLPVLCGKKGGA